MVENIRNRSIELFKQFGLWLIPSLFLLVFYFLPFGNIIFTSISKSSSSFFVVLLTVLSSQNIRQTIYFTFYQATLSTILTLVLGLPSAYLFARYDFKGKSFIRILTGLPFVMPTLVVAAAFSALIGSHGWINTLLMNIFNSKAPILNLSHTLAAILLAHVFYNTTIIIRIVGDFWSRLSPQLRSAAQVLGANRIKSVVFVTIPLIMPAILAAAILVFIFDFTSFGVILILGGPKFGTMEVEIYYQTIGLFNLPTAAVLSLIQLFFTLLLTIIYTRLSNKISKPLSLTSTKSSQNKLVSHKSKFFAGVILLLLISLTLLPLISLIVKSFVSSYYIDHSINNHLFTLDFYRELSINRRQSVTFSPPTTAIAVSFIYATLTVLFSLAIGLPAAYNFSRYGNIKINKILDPLLMLPLGTSAVTMGLGFIITFNKSPLNLRASPIIIPIAHTLIALPFVVRILTPALRSIQPRLKDAASVLGASPREVFQRIEYPIISKAIIVAATFAFTISMGEFGATALLTRPEYTTIPVLIYRFLSRPGALNYGQAMALSTLLMVIVVIGMVVIEKLRILDVGEF